MGGGNGACPGGPLGNWATTGGLVGSACAAAWPGGPWPGGGPDFRSEFLFFCFNCLEGYQNNY